MSSFRFSRRHLVFAAALGVGLLALLVVVPPRTLRVLASSLLAQRVLLILLLLFSLVTLSLLWRAGQRLDARVFLFFNLRGKRPRWLDWLMLGFTQLGNGALAFLLSIFFYATGYRRLAFLILLGVITLWLVVEMVKALTVRSRPYISMTNTRLLGWRERGRSFPSGHTAQTFFLMGLFPSVLNLNPAWSVVLIALAVLVGFTRVYIGVHYPRDVIAGAILGSVWAIMASLIDPYLVRGGYF